MRADLRYHHDIRAIRFAIATRRVIDACIAAALGVTLHLIMGGLGYGL